MKAVRTATSLDVRPRAYKVLRKLSKGDLVLHQPFQGFRGAASKVLAQQSGSCVTASLNFSLRTRAAAVIIACAIFYLTSTMLLACLRNFCALRVLFIVYTSSPSPYAEKSSFGEGRKLAIMAKTLSQVLLDQVVIHIYLGSDSFTPRLSHVRAGLHTPIGKTHGTSLCSL